MSSLRDLVCLVTAGLLLLNGGCFGLAPSKGGGQVDRDPVRRVNPADIELPPGYRIEAVATRLTFPTGVTFDDQGTAYVVESGYSYGEVWTTPRLLRIDADGTTAAIASGDHAPWTGVQYHDGAFYVAQGGADRGGRIVRIAGDGTITPLVEDLPSLGDHHTNGPTVGPDGMLYFAIGTATNSGVVGIDNHEFGWLKRHPDFHDIPAHDVKLAGKNFTTDDPMTPEAGDEAITGGYVPFGTPTRPGQIIRGKIPCTGAIFRISPEGGNPQLVAWGLRNPYGLAFSPDGKLFATENSFDVRGSRPVYGTGDLLWEVHEGLWHGWPDFFDGQPLTDPWFSEGGIPSPGFLLAEHPNDPPRAKVRLGVHSSSNGLDFSRSEGFGHVGQAFIAQFGDMAPDVGKVMGPVGYQVVQVDPATGTIFPFAANSGKTNGPASKLKTGGLERPTDAQFNPAGDALYVVDFGIMTMSKSGPQPRERSGVLWRITRRQEGR